MHKDNGKNETIFFTTTVLNTNANYLGHSHFTTTILDSDDKCMGHGQMTMVLELRDNLT